MGVQMAFDFAQVGWIGRTGVSKEQLRQKQKELRERERALRKASLPPWARLTRAREQRKKKPKAHDPRQIKLFPRQLGLFGGESA